LTRFALASEFGGYEGRVIRVVEAQHLISTNRLAASNADQALLEALADGVKPPLPEAALHLPWLLASPFRYGLGRPSRFRAANVLPGILYASEDIETAVTESAYWRLVAFSRSPGFTIPRTPMPMSAFSVFVRTAKALDLTSGRLSKREKEWTDKRNYAATQELADRARAVGAGAIRTKSARRDSGINVAILDPAAFVPPPKPHSSWAFVATSDGLLAIRETSGQTMRFGA
jgi:hypothetical protein